MNKKQDFIGQMKYEKNPAKKIDLTDRRILYILSIDCRITCSSIAKQLKISRQTTEYRIKRLVKEGYITGFTALIDIRKLGYMLFDIYFKFKVLTEEDEKNLVNFLAEKKEITWIAKLSGNYDFAISIASRNVESFYGILKGVLQEIGDKLITYELQIFLEEDQLDRQYILDGNSCNVKENKITHFEGEITQSERKLLPWLVQDSRSTLIDLHKKTGLSVITINTCIKELVKKRIIKRFMIQPSINMLDLQWYMVFLRLKSFKEDSMISFLNQIRDTDFYIRYAGKWNFAISFLSRDVVEFDKSVQLVKSKFCEQIEDYFSLIVLHQYKYQYLLE